MAQLGIGAMLHYLGGGSAPSPKEFVGKTISSAELKDEALFIGFEDGVRIKIFDNGQSCCESRYMRTDDDVQTLVGHKLMRIDAKDASEKTDGDYDVHEICFLEVGTDSGFVTVANHNQHNGYYGGFGLSIDVVTP